MKKNTPNTTAAIKVVLGFFLAAIFLVGVAGLTYYTLNRLLDTMSQLSAPNQKLDALNDLQAEIIQITQIDRLGPEGDFRVTDSTRNYLEGKLDELESLAADDEEQDDIELIRTNLDSLIAGYENLYEVKTNLANRNFTREALRNVEIGIRRRAEILENQPLHELNPRDIIINDIKQQTTVKSVTTTLPTAEVETSKSSSRKKDKAVPVTPTPIEEPTPSLPISQTPELDKLISSLQQGTSTSSNSGSGTLDSILFNIRGVINRIYREERRQRENLAQIETDLSIKQSDVITTIQDLLTLLQRRVLEESTEQNSQALGLANDVTFFLVIMVVLAVLGSGFMVYSILKEIRLNRKYQENLEASRLKSEQLARSKQEFLANMSHEIRNPLHVIQGYRSVMEKTQLDDRQKSQLKMIGFASETLMEIVDEVLDFSKLEAGKLKLETEPFDPEQLFSALQDFFDLKAQEKDLDFKWKLNLPEGKWLVGDQLRLKQIVNNLLSNAFKFTSHGWIQVRVDWGENTLSVEVEDSGIGMSEEVLSKVFREFDQADTSISRKYGGTGLGLAIVHRLAQLMGGTIEAKSEEGKGTSMKIVLPMESVEALSTKPLYNQQFVLNLTGKKILLVDDDPVGIQYLSQILNYFGAETSLYDGGAAFRDKFNGEDFDLAILDIQMPEFSGFDVIEMLKNHQTYLGQPILAMTANVFVEEKEKMKQIGFSDILFKPFQEMSLVGVLGRFFPECVTEIQADESEEEVVNTELFDLRDLNRFCMGDESLLKDILKDLIQETKKNVDQLQKARLNEKYDVVLEICHQLGSRLGQIKSETGDMARKIENSLKIGNKQGVGSQLVVLEEKIKELLTELNKFIESKAPAKT
ncbi:hybrid sensor histidine kinase/response regulator [Algoriphagus zhangzhouensis]|uniref:histidine kinase n=1 Tax=Algoriphagus zhangzhouensis TaxID=1073327 RepID=A0A1M7ZH02_9BACT|nr:ATP-binding protein [Algoriphagus zhangzhouensis]TDY44087.1 signal transduction histidine kinase [Algoriphagus zhangzhouensis]SHO64200.1 Signal transduction histidine kinase [Algoriphagus zhangzhouensis]